MAAVEAPSIITADRQPIVTEARFEGSALAMTPPRVAESRYLVDGITSTSCAAKISGALRRLPGILEVQVSESARVVTVMHIDDEVVPVTIEMQIRALGHKLSPIAKD